eukprot:UN26966
MMYQMFMDVNCNLASIQNNFKRAKLTKAYNNEKLNFIQFFKEQGQFVEI